jgi:hypothetical protein
MAVVIDRSSRVGVRTPVVVFDNEEHASAAAAAVEQGPPPGAPVTFRSVEMFEVLAEA